MGAFADDPLGHLLDGNESYVRATPPGTYDGLEDSQHPDVVTICCADSRVPQERMWGIDRPGTLFTPSTIGNQVWDVDGTERILDGAVAYGIGHAGADAVAVVGHTGCGAVAAAYDVATGGTPPTPRGVALWVEQLQPVVDRALESPLIDTEAPRRHVINQLVEWNVSEQVDFLLGSSVVNDTDVYGFVYDFQGTYGDEPGRCYLVNRNGDTDPEQIAAAIPDDHRHVARSLLR